MCEGRCGCPQVDRGKGRISAYFALNLKWPCSLCLLDPHANNLTFPFWSKELHVRITSSGALCAEDFAQYSIMKERIKPYSFAKIEKYIYYCCVLCVSCFSLMFIYSKRLKWLEIIWLRPLVEAVSSNYIFPETRCTNAVTTFFWSLVPADIISRPVAVPQSVVQ